MFSRLYWIYVNQSHIFSISDDVYSQYKVSSKSEHWFRRWNMVM